MVHIKKSLKRKRITKIAVSLSHALSSLMLVSQPSRPFNALSPQFMILTPAVPIETELLFPSFLVFTSKSQG